jgi:hypothetical protein
MIISLTSWNLFEKHFLNLKHYAFLKYYPDTEDTEKPLQIRATVPV